jgi:hypothetical protein
MMDCLVVWAALGPILAFIAGAVVIAWWDDEEEVDFAPCDRPGQTLGAIPGMPRQVVSFEPPGRSWSAWDRPSGPAAVYPGSRITTSCLQCGRMEKRP